MPKLDLIKPTPRLYTVPEFAEAHRLGRSSVYRLLATGELRGRKVGRRTYIGTEDAADWLRRLAAYTPTKSA